MPQDAPQYAVVKNAGKSDQKVLQVLDSEKEAGGWAFFISA
jgi:hypothetical protein